MRRLAITIALIGSSLAIGGAITYYAPGKPISAKPLNADLKHLHDTIVGQHGARLVDTDVSTDAGILINKLNDSALVPVAWGYAHTCPTTAAGDDCVDMNLQGFSNLEANPATGGLNGAYRAWFSTNRPDVNYAVIVKPRSLTAGEICRAGGYAVDYFDFYCMDFSGVAGDVGFSLFVMDNP